MLEAFLLVVAPLSPFLSQEVVTTWGYPPHLRISGRVVSEHGAPLEGATLRLRALMPVASKEAARGLSGPDGRFVLQARLFETSEGDLDRAYLEVQAPGFALSIVDRIPLPPPALDVGDVVLFAPIELSGSVADELGRPVAGAEIHAVLGPMSGPYLDHAERAPIATTDAKGEFVCTSLPPGMVTLGASAGGFADRVLAPRTLTKTSDRVRFVLAQARPSELAITAEDGRPIPDARALPMGDLPWWSRIRSPGLPGFWRGEQSADAQGRVRFEGLSTDHAPRVVLSARGFEPETLTLDEPFRQVSLRSATRLLVTAVRAADGSPVAIHSVRVRNSGPVDRCGNGELLNWQETWSDSDAVRVLAPHRWEIQRDSSISEWYRPFERPTRVSVTAVDGMSAWADLPVDVPLGQLTRLEVRFGAPAALRGRILDRRGRPVSMRLACQIDHRRISYWATTSGSDGTFSFDHIDSGDVWLTSLDPHWTIVDGDGWELEPGGSLEDARVSVRPTPPYTPVLARVRLTIGGRPPEKPTLVALDGFGQHLPDGAPRGFAWTDGDGWLEFESDHHDSYHVVPKRHVGAEAGGWRDFSAEFPAHGRKWPWIVTLPAGRSPEPTIDLLAESEWDKVAPPDD